MRISCPNCGAQYEVPDEVIPPEGRDVQCSNCGDTWYQAHPDHPETAAQHEPDTGGETVAEEDVEPDWYEDEEPQPEPAPKRRAEPEMSDILREEAEREARIREAESGALESQPELGLESHTDDEPARRAREARDRMARMRGEEPAPTTPPTDPGSRRGLLPDIEEINSSLRNSGEVTTRNELGPANEQTVPPRKKGGFARGLAIVVIVAVVLVLIYSNAQVIAEKVPQADPMLSAFVALVDQARVWLDAKASGLLPLR